MAATSSVIIVLLTLEKAVLSAIVVSPGGCEAAAPLLRCLQLQNICDRLEIVLVTTATSGLRVEEELLAGFARWKAVPVGPLVSMPAARAAGIRAASCRYIVFNEQHCFPEPGWGQAIIEAFEKRAADVVGPVFIKWKPGTRAKLR